MCHVGINNFLFLDYSTSIGHLRRGCLMLMQLLMQVQMKYYTDIPR
jgi:hypothetical protein